MANRLALVLAAGAFAISLAGTPLGHAAGELADAVVPRAKRADYATKAGFASRAGTAAKAANSTAVGGFKASLVPRPGYLVPLGGDGKFPESVGVAGPAGPKGDKGDKGDVGVQGPPAVASVELVTATSAVDTVSELKSVTASCPSGKKVIGGGAEAVSSTTDIEASKPVTDLSGWIAQGRSPGAGAFYGVRAYALCASVAG